MNERDGHEHREKSQWSIDSWNALQSAATLLMMAIAGLVWGLKLENRIDLLESRHRSDFDKLDDEIAAVEAATQKGILPIAEIKLHAMEVQINDIKKDIDVCLKSKR